MGQGDIVKHIHDSQLTNEIFIITFRMESIPVNIEYTINAEKFRKCLIVFYKALKMECNWFSGVCSRRMRMFVSIPGNFSVFDKYIRSHKHAFLGVQVVG